MTNPDDMDPRIATLESRIADLEAKLAESEDKLQRQEEFFQMAVHDLRSPLSAIVVYAELLMNRVMGDLDNRQLEPIRTIHRNCNNLIRMAEDVLASAKVRAMAAPIPILRLAPVTTAMRPARSMFIGSPVSYFLLLVCFLDLAGLTTRPSTTISASVSASVSASSSAPPMPL